MTYFIYRNEDGRPSVMEHALRLDLYPGWLFVDTVEERPDLDGKRWVDGEWKPDDRSNAKAIERMSAYPSAIELLEMLWDAMESGQIPKAVAFHSAMKAVMDKYGKEPHEAGR